MWDQPSNGRPTGKDHPARPRSAHPSGRDRLSATRVEIELAFALAGPLAQFGRGGIVTDLAARLTAAFADNLQAHLDTLAGATPAAGERDAGERDAGRLLLSAIWARIRAALAAILGRS